MSHFLLLLILLPMAIDAEITRDSWKVESMKPQSREYLKSYGVGHLPGATSSMISDYSSLLALPGIQAETTLELGSMPQTLESVKQTSVSTAPLRENLQMQAGLTSGLKEVQQSEMDIQKTKSSLAQLRKQLEGAHEREKLEESLQKQKLMEIMKTQAQLAEKMEDREAAQRQLQYWKEAQALKQTIPGSVTVKESIRRGSEFLEAPSSGISRSTITKTELQGTKPMVGEHVFGSSVVTESKKIAQSPAPIYSGSSQIIESHASGFDVPFRTGGQKITKVESAAPERIIHQTIQNPATVTEFIQKRGDLLGAAPSTHISESTSFLSNPLRESSTVLEAKRATADSAKKLETEKQWSSFQGGLTLPSMTAGSVIDRNIEWTGLKQPREIVKEEKVITEKGAINPSLDLVSASLSSGAQSTLLSSPFESIATRPAGAGDVLLYGLQRSGDVLEKAIDRAAGVLGK
jgi:hypothetical protein